MGLTNEGKKKKYNMNWFDQMVKLERMDWLISIGATGDLNKFARRVDVSTSTLYKLLRMMKDTGVVIRYDKEKKTYYYLTKNKVKEGIHPLD